MNYAALTSVHLAENEGNPAFTDTRSGEISHGAQLSLARSPKAFNVANYSLAFRRSAAECLVQQMLKSLEQFAPLCLQQL
jgi:hypothetical protein